MIFYYIRHGQPIYSPNCLTEYGKEQAEALVKRLALYGLDEIYSSPSTRALQTAQPTCDFLKKEPILLDWTDEGLAWAELTVERNGKRAWYFQHQEFVEKFSSKEMFALGEKFTEHSCFENTKFKSGIERIDREMDAFFLKLGFKHNREKGGYEVLQPNKKRVALFAHQGFGLAFLSSLLDIPYPTFCTKFDIGFTGVSVIYFDDTKEMAYPKVLQLSNDSHLYKEEILRSYQDWIDI